MNRFHSKNHRYSHQTYKPTNTNLPDIGFDPIASHQVPFSGDFVLAPSGTNENYLNPTLEPTVWALSARDSRLNYVRPFSGDWTYFPENVYIHNLSALSATVIYQDIVVSELSGFILTGTSTGLTIPPIAPTINAMTLAGVGVSSKNWATFDGNLQTKNDLFVSGDAYINNLVVDNVDANSIITDYISSTYGEFVDFHSNSANIGILQNYTISSTNGFFTNLNVTSTLNVSSFSAKDLYLSGCLTTDCITPIVTTTSFLDTATPIFNGPIIDISNEIASICYNEIRGTVFLIGRIENASDAKHVVYEYDDRFTTILGQVTTVGLSDIEGIDWLEDDSFIVVGEEATTVTDTTGHSFNISKFPIDYNLSKTGYTLDINKAGMVSSVNLDFFNGKGPEGITYNNNTGEYYIVREGIEGNVPYHIPTIMNSISCYGVFKLVPAGANTFNTTPLFNAPEKLSAFFNNIHPNSADLSDIYYHSRDNTLFLASHRASSIINVDLNGNIIDSIIGLPTYQLEGIAFDRYLEELYIVSEGLNSTEPPSGVIYTSTVITDNTINLNGYVSIDESLTITKDLTLSGDIYNYGDSFVRGTVFTDKINIFTPQNTAIQILNNIDMDGNSIVNIGNNSLTFESGAAIQSNISGNIVLNCIGFSENNTCSATGLKSHSEGAETSATGNYSHAEGQSSNAIGINSHAEGNFTKAIGSFSHSEGTETSATGNYSHAEGQSTNAIGERSHAEGYLTQAIGIHSHADGINSIAAQANTWIWSNNGASTTSANQFKVSADNGVVLGQNVEINGNLILSSQAISTWQDITNFITVTATPTLTGDIYTNNIYQENTGLPITLHSDTIIEGSLNQGYLNVATGTQSHATGYQTSAIGLYSHSEGDHTIAYGDNSHAAGDRTYASGINSQAIGYETSAIGANSFALGYRSSTIYDNSYIWSDNGASTTSIEQFKVSATNGVVLGQNVEINGNLILSSQAISTWQDITNFITVTATPTLTGDIYTNNIYQENTGLPITLHSGQAGTIIEGSLTQGYLTSATGDSSHAEGRATLASGIYSHTEGWLSIATGNASHAEGRSTIANGTYSHAEGYNCEANGTNSHAEGSSTIAGGINSHAEGTGSQALSTNSHAAGAGSIALHYNTWIWSNNGASTTSANQFKVSADNGVVLGQNVEINGNLTITPTVTSGVSMLGTGLYMSLTVNGSALWIPLYQAI